MSSASMFESEMFTVHYICTVYMYCIYVQYISVRERVVLQIVFVP